MRHRKTGRKLGRTAAHRKAMKRNLSESLLRHERIRTTLAKAKEIRPFVERLITLSKEDSVHSRRIFARQIQDRKLIQHVYTVIGPRYRNRPGGYTRILRTGNRPGDGAEMAIIELVERETESVSQVGTKST